MKKIQLPILSSWSGNIFNWNFYEALGGVLFAIVRYSYYEYVHKDII